MIPVSWGARSIRHVFNWRRLVRPVELFVVFYSLGFFVRMLWAAGS